MRPKRGKHVMKGWLVLSEVSAIANYDEVVALPRFYSAPPVPPPLISCRLPQEMPSQMMPTRIDNLFVTRIDNLH